MLGQDASFAYIRAVELCASTNIFQKRVGFLACKFLHPTSTLSASHIFLPFVCTLYIFFSFSLYQVVSYDNLSLFNFSYDTCHDMTASLFLSPEHEFRFMLVNQIQRDMARWAVVLVSDVILSFRGFVLTFLFLY